MQLTPNLNLKKPEGTDIVDIADLNSNTDKLDAEVVKLATPAAPGRMSAADKTMLDGATSAARASTLVQRDASGRFKATAPAAADDVARKQEITDHVDVKATITGGYGHTTLVDSTNSNATDKAATANAVKQAYDQADRVAVQTIDIGGSLETAVTPGFYRIQHSHPDAPVGSSYGTMLVVRNPGTDTISQTIYAPNTTRMWLRTGNSPDVDGSGSWSQWGEILTQFGGTITNGALEVLYGSGGIILANNTSILGRWANGSTSPLAYVNTANVTIYGNPNSNTSVHSQANPTWWNGAVLRDFMHTSGGQTVQGTTTFANVTVNGQTLIAGGAGKISLNSTESAVAPQLRSSDSGADAFLTFHIPNNIGCHFGLDASSHRLKIGGWSMGATAHTIWDSRNLAVSSTAPANPLTGDIWIDTSA